MLRAAWHRPRPRPPIVERHRMIHHWPRLGRTTGDCMTRQVRMAHGGEARCCGPWMVSLYSIVSARLASSFCNHHHGHKFFTTINYCGTCIDRSSHPLISVCHGIIPPTHLRVAWRRPAALWPDCVGGGQCLLLESCWASPSLNPAGLFIPSLAPTPNASIRTWPLSWLGPLSWELSPCHRSNP